MYLQKIREQMPQHFAYSLKVPEHSLLEVRTVIVACCEQGAIPTLKELERLQPLAYVLIPGAQLHKQTAEQRASADIMHPPPKSEYSLNFFETVLSNMPNVEDVIICTHNGCIYTNEPDLEQQLQKTAGSLQESDRSHQRLIKLHAWHFEPEVNWVSFFDSDTRQMLPLSAAPIFS